ncbi:MAG: hypothetical protein HYV07_28620 [Deltaproteobacteria bacterium]|nr:hypothetical protein [Deltaproteobacteria bacterium]
MRALGAFWFACLMASEVVVVASPSSRDIATFLELLVDARTVVDTSTRGPSVETARRRTDLHGDLVLVIDERAGAMAVIRSDGTTVTRSMEGSAITRSPYALAVSARELVELVRSRPEQRVAPLASFAAHAGVATTFDPGNGPNPLQLDFGLALVTRPAEGWFLKLGPVGRVPFELSRRVVFEGDGIDVAYRRYDALLEVSVGLERGRARGSLGALVGTGFSDATALKPNGSEVHESRVSPELEARAEVGFAPFRGVRCLGSFGAAFVSRPVRFLVGQRVVFEEDVARLSATLGLELEVPN